MSESELTVKYEPFKEIVIMEQNPFNTPEDLARFTSVIAGGKLAGLYWTEGVVFLYFPLPASTYVGYTLMPKYQPTIETKEKMIIPIIDVSTDPVLTQVAKWLKQQKTPAPANP
jgi:hypothetical protein